jgi:2-oxoglutarate ferredoxin oxidoreductase subunit alpha
MDRLVRKLETGRGLLPAPVLEEPGAEIGIIAYGSSHHAVVEARVLLAEERIETDYLRIRALPASDAVSEFVARHARVYVVDQNRDGQMEQILQVEIGPELAARLRSVRHYDGLPLFAADLVAAIRGQERGEGEAPRGVPVALGVAS